MKSHTRLLVSLLIISMVANTAACSKKIKAHNQIESRVEINQTVLDKPLVLETETIEPISQPPIEEIIEDKEEIFEFVDIPPEVIETKEVTLEDRLKESLYDENIDYKLVIKTYLNTDYDKREELKNDYLRAIYMLMYNSNVPMSTYINELNNLIVMQQVPMCVPEDIWNMLFGNLIALDQNCLSIYEMYIDIAMYIHNLSCDKEHYINDYYGYSCEYLEKEYTRTLEIPFI